MLLNFDVTGAKVALRDEVSDIQSKNIVVGPPDKVRPRPNPPIAGIPAWPLPVLPVGALNATNMNLANMQVNYHNPVVARENAANLLCCTKYLAIIQYVKTAHL